MNNVPFSFMSGTSYWVLLDNIRGKYIILIKNKREQVCRKNTRVFNVSSNKKFETTGREENVEEMCTGDR